MRVNVTPMRDKGRNLNRGEQLGLPKHQGELFVAEEQDPTLSRRVVRARLVDDATGVDADILPRLWDAKLLWASKTTLRIAGFENIEGADYAQTWVVELLPC